MSFSLADRKTWSRDMDPLLKLYAARTEWKSIGQPECLISSFLCVANLLGYPRFEGCWLMKGIL